MQIFSANRHHEEIFTSGVIGCQRFLIEKALFFGFFATFRPLDNKLKIHRGCRATVIFLRWLLRAVVNGVELGQCVRPQCGFIKTWLRIICCKKSGFSQLSQNERGITLRDRQKSILRQILGQETCNFNQIRYKLIFNWDIYVFGRFNLFFAVEKWKKSLWLNRKIFKSNFYGYCATFWVQKNGNGYNHVSLIFDSNINTFDAKCPFRAFSLKVEISA